MPTMTFVVQGTLLSPPLQGLAHRFSPSTSALRHFRNTSDEVIIMKESSVSKWEDREFRLVDPKSVNIGADSGVGDSQIPIPQCSVPGLLRMTVDLFTFGMVCPPFFGPFIQLDVFSLILAPPSPGVKNSFHKLLLKKSVPIWYASWQTAWSIKPVWLRSRAQNRSEHHNEEYQFTFYLWASGDDSAINWRFKDKILIRLV